MSLDIDYYTRSLDCVHCGLCIQVCPTYRELGLESDSPRGRIYLMRAIAESRIDDVESVKHHLDRCLDCRACETACPSGVQYGSILETVRSDLEERVPRRGLSARLRRFALRHLVAHQGRLRLGFRFARLAEVIGLRKLAFALRILPKRMDSLVPRVPPAAERRVLRGVHSPEGPPRARVALFTGCVMEQIFGRINQSTLDVLVANGIEVVVPTTQGCCGALMLHDGLAADAKRLAARNVAAFGELDVDFIVNNSAGCGAAMKEYGDLLGTPEARAFAEKCRDATELLGELGLTAQPAPFPSKVAYDAPCHLCHAQGVRGHPENLLSQVPGLELVDHPSSEDCCGSAGIYNLVHADLASSIGERKVGHLVDSGADVVATGNPGCMMQIRSHLAAAGSSQRVVHPIELLLPKKPE